MISLSNDIITFISAISHRSPPKPIEQIHVNLLFNVSYSSKRIHWPPLEHNHQNENHGKKKLTLPFSIVPYVNSHTNKNRTIQIYVAHVLYSSSVSNKSRCQPPYRITPNIDEVEAI